MFVLRILDRSMEQYGSKTRSHSQIKENYFEQSRKHILYLIFMKNNQNVCLNDVLTKFEYGLLRWKVRSHIQINEEYYQHF